MLFDVLPYALPHGSEEEIRFEEPRDIMRIELTLKDRVPKKIGVAYRQHYWPGKDSDWRCCRVEQREQTEDPALFGWVFMDDWFNGSWRNAKINLKTSGNNKVAITFKPLSQEYGADVRQYDVQFRRTLGLRLTGLKYGTIRKVRVFTTGTPVTSRVRVTLDAGAKTKGKLIQISGYNAVVKSIEHSRGVSAQNERIHLGTAKTRSFEVVVDHLQPAHELSGDMGLLSFRLDHDQFTIRIDDLSRQGPIWYQEEGVFITRGEDQSGFQAYRKHYSNQATITQEVCQQREQTFHGAFYGQPRPHPVNYNLGCKHSRQRFWLEHNGDLLLIRANVHTIKGRDTDKYLNTGNARFFFGLEEWAITARYNDPAPVLAYTIKARKENLIAEQRSCAVPLAHSILDGEPMPDEPIVAMLQFRFKNNGESTLPIQFPVGYSQSSDRSINGWSRQPDFNDCMIRHSELEPLRVQSGKLWGQFNGKPVLRAMFETDMSVSTLGEKAFFSKKLSPGQECLMILKVPFITLSTKKELDCLKQLDFQQTHQETTVYWRKEQKKCCQLQTPVEHLNALHAAHWTHVAVTDIAMPDAPSLVNVSVGSSTYGNFSNESCMIIQELEQRGLIEEARRRLAIWIKYQGTCPQPGNFSDYDGMYYGAGGFECGAYNQHHGWVLWRLCDHFLMTGDRQWFSDIAASVIAGADWVFRQRAHTKKEMPYSRGWEAGFLPAGSLEDVEDFYYWLSTNSLTWRGCEYAARALEAFGHPQAKRVRQEANAYRQDLVTGFETMRQHSPLVKLRDGRWVPHYPSRLYCRGRDVGWIRETLEGAIYLLISGLYDANSKQADWILNDYQDNRFLHPPYGYHIIDVDKNFYHRGGLSIQPNLLAGLMPYLDRDEPEMYLWMFFNCWCSCYREEICAMVEHPIPVLGYSNAAHFKTSDQANAVMWLRYLLAYWKDNTLYLGRAMPRSWMETSQTVSLQGVMTHAGVITLDYTADQQSDTITGNFNLTKVSAQTQVIARFRHPHAKPIKSVIVNGNHESVLDAVKGDVDLTKLSGKRVRVIAQY